MFVNRNTLTVGTLLVVSGVVGCGGSATEPAAQLTSFQGSIDPSLSREQQAQQAVVQKLLNAFLEGAADSTALAIYAPGVDFQEQVTPFAGEPGQLVRWEFNGAPKGQEVPISLYFDDAASGLVHPDQQRREERTLVVTRQGNRFAVKPR